MRRLFWPICIVLIAIVLFSGFGEMGEAAPAEGTFSVSEAAFAMRTSGSEDVTGFLVGRFDGDKGTRLSFDGVGGVWETGVNLDTHEGSAFLTQSKGGSTLLRLDIDGTQRLYTFRLISAEGNFILTDADGGSETFQPLL